MNAEMPEDCDPLRTVELSGAEGQRRACHSCVREAVAGLGGHVTVSAGVHSSPFLYNSLQKIRPVHMARVRQ